MEKQTKDWRFAQANKEALFTLGAYALYFIWWYVCSYGMGSGDPEEYEYIFGLPEWFFYSCIVGYPLITIILWGLVRFKFKHMPLEEESEDEISRKTGEGQS
ncbi:YhdT family protein [Maridesulfovibrio sp.]|uniref:YhdT family protein n=1 Tax=Maridesulfovibrio sp. TaxID=2795000 RepID=UPI0029C9D7FD|nr:YhdT family protein [Maridesulfovibrio sp.]